MSYVFIATLISDKIQRRSAEWLFVALVLLFNAGLIWDLLQFSYREINPQIFYRSLKWRFNTVKQRTVLYQTSKHFCETSINALYNFERVYYCNFADS